MKFLDGLTKFIVALLVISVLGLLILTFLYFKGTDIFPASTKEKSNETIKTRVIKTGLSTAISAATGKDVDVNEYIEKNVSKEDAEFINKMLDEKIDLDTATQIVESYAEDGSLNKETIEELKDTFSEEEQQKIFELSEEYGEDFLDYIK